MKQQLLKLKHHAKGFAAGLLVAALVIPGASALANAVTRQITVTSGHVSIVVDGQQVQPLDAQGNLVEPFIYEGTTFVPVRAIAAIAGLTPSWDSATSTVYLDRNAQGPAVTAPAAPAVTEPTVTEPTEPAITEPVVTEPTEPVATEPTVPEVPATPAVTVPTEPTQPTVPTEPEAPVQGPAVQNQSVVGVWIWNGLPFYTFNANGTGTMGGGIMDLDIRWTTNNGVLGICMTPEICGTNCIAPIEWDYTITGNELRLHSRLLGTTYTYTRQ